MTTRFASLFPHTSVQRSIVQWLPYHLVSWTFQPRGKPSSLRLRVRLDCKVLGLGKGSPWLLASPTRIVLQRSSFFAFIMVAQVGMIVGLRKKYRRTPAALSQANVSVVTPK